MKRMVPVLVIGAALVGFMAGQAMRPKPEGVMSGHFDEPSMMPSAIAQDKGEVMPFGYNSPRQPALAPDAPPISRETRSSHKKGAIAVIKKFSPRPKIETRRTARRPQRSLIAPNNGAETN